MATKPDNFGGSQADYDAAKATERDRMESNLEWNLGSNWSDLYDADRQEYRPGSSASDASGGRFGTLRNTGYDIGKNGGSGGGTYSGGGISGGQNGYNPYAEAQRKAEEARRLAIEAGVGTLEAQKPLVGQAYDDVARQAYAAYRLGQQRLPGQTQGLASGMADTLQLQGNLSYQNSLQASERERQNALAGINNDITKLQTTGESQIADQAGQYAQMAAQYQQQQEQLAYRRAMEQRQYADAARQREFENSLAQKQFARQEMNAAKGASGGGNGAYSGTGKPKLTYDQIKKELEAGNSSETLRQWADYYGVDPQMYLPTVTNYTGSSGSSVSVAGMGRLSAAEVAAGIQAGRIAAYKNESGSITYRKV